MSNTIIVEIDKVQSCVPNIHTQTYRARETRAAEPMANPLPMAAVVLPAASSASVHSRTF